MCPALGPEPPQVGDGHLLEKPAQLPAILEVGGGKGLGDDTPISESSLRSWGPPGSQKSPLFTV